MYYIELLKGLFDENVRYMLCGGLAVNIYGIPRMTADIDIILDFERNNFCQFEKVLTKLNYQKILPVQLYDLLDEKKRKELKDTKNLIAFSFYNTAASYMNLDILIDIPIPFLEMWKNKTERQLDNFKVYLVSIEHLIEMKAHSDRIQDKQDIIHLTKLLKK